MLNNGDASFVLDSSYAVGTNPISIFAADLDGDANNDLAVANFTISSISVLINNGDGTFAPFESYSVGTRPRFVYAADFDGDGNLDIATANRNSSNVSILINNGDGTFGSQTDFAVGLNPVSISAADLDGDADMDLATANIGSANISVLLNEGTTGIVESSIPPQEFSAWKNYPNPFNASTVIEFSLEKPQFVTLTVYDLLGREIKTLMNEERSAGKHRISFDASSLSSGVYFYRLRAGDRVESKRMVLLK